MTSIILCVSAASVLGFLGWPLIGKSRSADAIELEVLRQQLKAVDEGDELSADDQTSSSIERLELEARVLEHINRSNTNTEGNPAPAFFLLAFLGVSLAVFMYAAIGSPEFAKKAEEYSNLQSLITEDVSLETLAQTLQEKLTEDPNPPAQGYQLLGRSLMGLQRFEEAIEAYEVAVELSQEDGSIIEELERARALIGTRASNELTDAQITAFENLSPEDRDVMIGRMVDGLYEKLTNNPRDILGWQRLLQARKVLGQESRGLEELRSGLAALSDDPKLQQKLRDISTELGYDLVRKQVSP